MDVTSDVTVVPSHELPRLGRAMSVAAFALGLTVTAGAVVAFLGGSPQQALLEGRAEIPAKFAAVMLASESIVPFTALAALLVDRSRWRVLAVAGLGLWVVAQAGFAIDQLRLYDVL